MQNLISNTLRHIFGATLTALLVAASTLVSAPAAFAAPASDATADTVLVPRITKGSFGVSMRVKRDSPQAKRYFASLARAEAPQSVNCPGTICPKTLVCYDTKGALGVGCISG